MGLGLERDRLDGFEGLRLGLFLSSCFARFLWVFVRMADAWICCLVADVRSTE